MNKIQVEGGYPLYGQIAIEGSKNAALPIMAACIMAEGTTVLDGVPDIRDVRCMIELLERLGCQVNFKGHTLEVACHGIESTTLQEEAVKDVRASVLFLGSILSTKGKVVITYPGGCSIGTRPIDFHLKAFEKMGANVTVFDTHVAVETQELKGSKISLPFASVGATENILLAAVLAHGVTWIENAAREPEIVEFCSFLKKMGADIQGEGTPHIIVTGVKKLKTVNFRIGYDRIVLATYALMVAGVGGELQLDTGVEREVPDLEVLTRLGCTVRQDKGRIIVSQHGRPKPISYIATRPYPGFSTDTQSQLLSTLSVASGESVVEENVFENRFHTAIELEKMGAHMNLVGRQCHISGVKKLHGAIVSVPDLRGGAALIEAGLMANGDTLLEEAEILERGYENLVENLQSVGAHIRAL